MKIIPKLKRGDLVSDFTCQLKFLYYETNVDYMETGYLICTNSSGQRVRLHFSDIRHIEYAKKSQELVLQH
jgi:hypothetical protein